MLVQNKTGDELTINGIMFYPYETKFVNDKFELTPELVKITEKKASTKSKTKIKKSASKK